MSNENAEKLHEIYELVNTRFAALKRGEMDEFVAFFDPEVVIEAVDAPDPETYHGHDGVRSWFNDVWGPWAAVHLEAEDIMESGQWTVALLHVSLRGEASGVELELPVAVFHQFRGGKIVRDRIYLDRDEGLEAFGVKNPSDAA
jgi:ketosteroid isomerase-like protein